MELDELRKEIDRLDAEVIRLINERAELAKEIGHAKSETKQPLYVPAREQAVYEHVSEVNEGPLSDACVKAVFREIMSGCLALQKGLKIAYLGPEGSFTHEAALSKFGGSVEYVAVPTLEDVFEEVERGRADMGVVPVENSTEGGIHETLTRFLNSPLKVQAEITRQIHHSLLANCPLEEVTTVYSKLTVFVQTRRWLKENLPHARQADVSSTSAAAERACHEKGAAAIARADVASRYGLKVLRENIQDYAHNVTRFFLLGNSSNTPTGDDKTALLCSTKDKVGALHDLLAPFKKHGINMTKIESFPSPTTAWQYYFFIDFLGHPDQERIRLALEEMEKECVEFRILGAFPRNDG